MTILPVLLVLACSEGHSCDVGRDASYYPMPDWETCRISAQGSAAAEMQSSHDDRAMTHASSFAVVRAICVGFPENKIADLVNNL